MALCTYTTRTNELRVNTAEGGKKLVPFFYLRFIGLDFIDGLVLELESQEFQHFFPREVVARSTVYGGNKNDFPRVPMASS